MATRNVNKKEDPETEEVKAPELPPADQEQGTGLEVKSTPATAARRGDGWLVVKETFHCPYGTYLRGDLVEESDPVVEGRERMFVGAEDRVRTTSRR